VHFTLPLRAAIPRECFLRSWHCLSVPVLYTARALVWTKLFTPIIYFFP